jgi:acetyltransferase
MLDSNLADKGITIDGKPVRFRLLRVEDIDLWTDFVRDCSQESLWLRFLSPFSPTPERAKRYCDIDPEEEFAIVAEMNEGGRRKVIGIARLVKITINSNHEAEYAVIVSDPWQKKTLGHQLSEMSIGLARQWGIRSVLTETVRDNHAMIKILKRCNFKVDNKCGNMFSLSLRF